MRIVYTYLSTDYCLLMKLSVAHRAFVGEIKCPLRTCCRGLLVKWSVSYRASFVGEIKRPLPTRCRGLLVKWSVSHRVFVIGEIKCPLPTCCRLVGEISVICNNEDVTIKHWWHLIGGQALMWQVMWQVMAATIKSNEVWAHKTLIFYHNLMHSAQQARRPARHPALGCGFRCKPVLPVVPAVPSICL